MSEGRGYQCFWSTVREGKHHGCASHVQVNSFVGAFHDAVILYALALNESLEAGVSISNGSEITRRMWNRTFDGEYWTKGV